jgi:hypothetical protein
MSTRQWILINLAHQIVVFESYGLTLLQMSSEHLLLIFCSLEKDKLQSYWSTRKYTETPFVYFNYAVHDVLADLQVFILC